MMHCCFGIFYTGMACIARFTLEWHALHVYTGMEGIGTCARNVKAKAYAEGGPQVHVGAPFYQGDWGRKGGRGKNLMRGPKF